MDAYSLTGTVAPFAVPVELAISSSEVFKPAPIPVAVEAKAVVALVVPAPVPWTIPAVVTALT